MLKFHESNYLKFVILIYKISDDNKQKRLYYYSEVVKIFDKHNIDKWHYDKLLLDLNLLEYKEYSKKATRTEVNINENNIIKLKVETYNLISGAYRQ